MPKGQYERKNRDFGYKILNKRTHLFRVNVRFEHKKSNPKVWEYLKRRIERDIEDYTEITEELVKMSDSELDMLQIV